MTNLTRWKQMIILNLLVMGGFSPPSFAKPIQCTVSEMSGLVAVKTPPLGMIQMNTDLQVQSGAHLFVAIDSPNLNASCNIDRKPFDSRMICSLSGLPGSPEFKIYATASVPVETPTLRLGPVQYGKKYFQIDCI